MCATHHAPRDRFYLFERRRGLAEKVPAAAGGRRDAVVRCRDAGAVAAASSESAEEARIAVFVA